MKLLLAIMDLLKLKKLIIMILHFKMNKKKITMKKLLGKKKGKEKLLKKELKKHSQIQKKEVKLLNQLFPNDYL